MYFRWIMNCIFWHIINAKMYKKSLCNWKHLGSYTCAQHVSALNVTLCSHDFCRSYSSPSLSGWEVRWSDYRHWCRWFCPAGTHPWGGAPTPAFHHPFHHWGIKTGEQSNANWRRTENDWGLEYWQSLKMLVCLWLFFSLHFITFIKSN